MPKAWQIMLQKIYEILDEHPENHNYGIDRILLALNQRGEYPSVSTVIRAMKKGNLLHESHRSPDGLTKKDKKARQPKNIVNRGFTAKEANVKWLTDITQTPCRDGKLYIAPVMNCFGGEIISLVMDSNMKKELCIKAPKEACMLRKPKSSFLTKMTMEEVKTEVWRFVQYYNRIRICTFNEGGYPPAVYREKVAAGEIKAAA